MEGQSEGKNESFKTESLLPYYWSTLQSSLEKPTGWNYVNESDQYLYTVILLKLWSFYRLTNCVFPT